MASIVSSVSSVPSVSHGSGGFVDVAPSLSHGHGDGQVGSACARGRASRARRGVDFAALTAELDALFRRRGARSQAAPLELRLWHGHVRAIASFVLESETVARAVVTHVRVWPVFEGVALVVHPRAEIDAPLLVADLMVPPTGRARAFVDVCGPAIAEHAFGARFREPLAAILDGAHVPRRAPVPAWIAALSGGAGGRLSAKRGGGDVLAATLARYVARYLDALDDAARDRAGDGAANVAAARAVASAVRGSGPASRHLARAFGRDFAQRYLDLLWRGD